MRQQIPFPAGYTVTINAVTEFNRTKNKWRGRLKVSYEPPTPEMPAHEPHIFITQEFDDEGEPLELITVEMAAISQQLVSSYGYERSGETGWNVNPTWNEVN